MSETTPKKTTSGAPDRGRVLLLMPTTSYRAHDFLTAGRRLGVRVVVGSDRRQALEEAVPGHTLTLDFTDVEGSTRTIVRFADEHPLLAVVGADEETTLLAAAASRALGLPHNPPEAVATTRSKYRLRRTLQEAGLPNPEFRLVPADGDPATTARKAPYPCVLKPTFLSASRGVIRADDPDSFIAAHRRIATILADPELRRRGGEEAEAILVEGYVPGEEYAVEGILSEGKLHVLALFDKPDPLEGPTFEETIYVTPSRAPEPTRRRILDTVHRAVAAVGLREGPTHAEVRVNEEGVYLLDLAARAIGGLCPRVLRFGTGLSLEELILLHALGEDPSAYRRESTAAGVMMIPIPRGGILRQVRGLEEARAVPGIDEVTVSIPRGQPVVPLPEGNRYLGFIFARRETPEETEAALRQAHRRLHFEILEEQEAAPG